MRAKIIFEDEDILVIEKNAGIVVNKSDTSRGQETIQEWAEDKLKIKSEKLKVEEDSEFLKRGGVGRTERDGNYRERRRPAASGSETAVVGVSNEDSDFYKRGGIVHRLDKETSGLLVIAKNEDSFVNLQAQFKSRNVKKTYIALVHGELRPAEGQINAPIGRLPWNRTRFGILPQGREASSKYKVVSIKYYVSDKTREALSLVEVYPETGRTHQIRVHMKYIGYPIFADELYAGRKISKRDRKLLPRHFLHASHISFTHPKTGQSIEFESPLPEDLQQFLDALHVH